MRRRAAMAVATVAVLGALGAYAWRAQYARYFRDDFCTAVSTRVHGPVGMMVDFRQRWSGRFSYFVLKGVVESAGAWTPRVVPGLLLAGFVAAGVFALRRFGVATSPAMLVATAVVFATFDAAPAVLAIGGPLLWETGALTYTLPLILFTLWLALLASEGSWALRSVLGAALMFFAGGHSETSVAAQGALTGAAVVAFVLLRDRKRALIAACCLTATLIALAIVWSAPGNAVRASHLPEPPPLPTAALETLRTAFFFVGSETLPHGWALLLMIVAASVLAAHWRIRARAAVAAGLVTLAAFVASFLPSVWSLGTAPPERALLVSNFFLVVSVGAFALAFNSRTRAEASRDLRADYAALVILSIIPIVSAIQTVRDAPHARAIATEIDRIHATLSARRGHDVVLDSEWAASTRFATTSQWDDVTRCVAAYYGLRSLEAAP